jgi:hypothetical protein
MNEATWKLIKLCAIRVLSVQPGCSGDPSLSSHLKRKRNRIMHENRQQVIGLAILRKPGKKQRPITAYSCRQGPHEGFQLRQF